MLLLFFDSENIGRSQTWNGKKIASELKQEKSYIDAIYYYTTEFIHPVSKGVT